MKIKLTETEYLACLEDLATNGSLEPEIDSETGFQIECERANAYWELAHIIENPSELEYLTWHYNATWEEAEAREYMEKGPYGYVEK